MKTRGITGMLLILLACLPGIAQVEPAVSEQEADSNAILVYYFHFERRCATCVAVETESEKALQELYPERVQTGEIKFVSVNLEDKSGDALAGKLGVDGQSLLVVKGTKQDNLTNVAFMHARTNPDRLKEAIRESVDKL